jgi:filamentous hemagglutinin family protein
MVLLPSQAALADPQGEHVVSGDVSFSRDGALTQIEASHNSIIEYQSFDIQQHETVQFIQPSAQARVLNRVLGVDPSQIHGALLANGQVYILNQAGIYFGGTAVVDVGGLYAVAGALTNADFLAHIDSFTELTGSVENWGEIRAEVAGLIGQYVANHGTIVAPEGLVAMVAGDEVVIGQLGGNITIKVDTGAPLADVPAVANTGLIDAHQGRVILAAGDIYSLAVRHPGLTRARDITVAGGDGGVVEVSGTLDASDTSPGANGGSVKVLGDKVGLFDEARIDVSGDTGGGEVLIGGDYKGQGEVRNASRTYVAPGARIQADASTEGDGGKVIVWSDEATGFYGDISARGGATSGDGGFVETSSKGYLEVAGASVDASASSGAPGTWLLDPRNVTIDDHSPPDGFSGGDPLVFTPSATVSVADRGTIETTLSGGTSVTVTTVDATASEPGNITVDASVTKDAGALATLTLQADNDITVSQPIASTGASAGLNVDLQGNAVQLAADIEPGSGGAITGTAPTVTVEGSAQIQDGIDAVADAGMVTVAAGVYDEQLNIPRAITLTGPVDPTGLDLTDPVDLAQVAVVRSDATPAPGVFDVEIDTSDVTVENLVFDFNGGTTLVDGSRGGQGIVVSDLDGPDATNVTIRQNEIYTGDGSGLGGTAIQTGKNANVSGLLISGNKIHGDLDGMGEGVYVNPLLDTLPPGTTKVTIDDNEIDGNLFAGVSIEASDVTVTNNQINSDAAQGIYGVRFIDLAGGANHENVKIGQAGQGNTIQNFGTDILVRAHSSGTQVTDIEILENGAAGVEFRGPLTLETVTVRTAAGTVDVQDDVSLQAGGLDIDTTANGASGAVITLAAKVDGVASDAGALTLDSGSVGTSELLGAVGSDRPIELLTATGRTEISGGVVETVGTQTYNDAVDLQQDTVLTGTDVTFNSTVDGGFDLTVTASNQTRLNGLVGDTTPLTSLLANGGGTTFLNSAGTALSPTVETTAAQQYDDAVELQQDAVLTGTDVTFNSTVDGSAALTVTASNETRFNGLVGDTTPLTSLLANGGGTTFLNASGTALSPTVETALAQQYDDTVELQQDAVLTGTDVTFNSTVDGSAALTVTASNETRFNGLVGDTTPLTSLLTNGGGTTFLNASGTALSPTVETTAAQQYDDAVELEQDTVLTGTDVTFNSTVDGSAALTVTASNETRFNGLVGDTTLLTSLLTNGGGTTFLNAAGTALSPTVETTAAQQYDDAVELEQDTVLIGTDVTFKSTLGVATNDLTLTFDKIDFKGGTNSVSGSGALTMQPTQAVDSIDIGSPLGGTGKLDLSDEDLAALANGLGQITIGRDDGTHVIVVGSSEFRDPVTIRSPSLGGSIEIKGLLRGTGDASVVLTGSGNTTTLNADIETEGEAITINDSVEVGHGLNIALDTTANLNAGGANIDLNGTVNSVLGGSGALTLKPGSTGKATLAEAVGTQDQLTSLEVQGEAAINGGAVRTDTTQLYEGAVMLGQDTLLTGTDVTFDSAVDGSAALTVTASNGTRFNGLVGDTTPLTSLLTNGGGTTFLNASGTAVSPTVETTTAQQYDDAVELEQDSVLTGTGVTFNSTVDGSAALTVTASSETRFNERVGGTTPLTGLLTNGGGRTFLNASGTATDPTVETTAGQRYDGAVTLEQDTVLTGAEMTFNSTVDSKDAGNPRHLEVRSGGDTAFNGAVGEGAPLLTLESFAARTLLPDAVVRTADHQVYWSDLGIPAGRTASLDAGTWVGVDGDVEGPGGLTIAAGAGLSPGDLAVGFTGNIGDAERLASLSIQAAEGEVVFYGSGPTTVLTEGNLELNPADRSNPSDVATIHKYWSGDLILNSQNGNVTIGRGERLTVPRAMGGSLPGNLTIQAANGTVTVGDLTANQIALAAGRVVVQLREAGPVRLPGGTQVDDNGTDLVGNQITIDAAQALRLDGTGKLTLGTPTRADSELEIAGADFQLDPGQELELRSLKNSGDKLTAADLVDNWEILDGVPRGPGVPLDPGVIPVVVIPEPPEPPDLGPAPPKADEVLAWLQCAQLTEDEEVPEECLPEVAAAPGEPAPTTEFDRPEFEAEDAVNALELYRGLLRNPQSVEEMRSVFGQAFGDYRLQTGAARIEGGPFRQYLEGRPEHGEAANYLDQIAFLLTGLEGMQLLPGEFLTLKEALLAEMIEILELQGISPSELGEAIEASVPSRGRPAAWLLELFEMNGPLVGLARKLGAARVVGCMRHGFAARCAGGARRVRGRV